MSITAMDVAVGLGLTAPLVCAGAALLPRRSETVLRVALWGALACAVVDAVVALLAWKAGTWVGLRGWVRVDALSTLHLALLALVYGSSSAFAISYFDHERGEGGIERRTARVFGALWCAAMFAMTLLLVSNSLGLMWVGMETTTLVTAFLIALHLSRESLEAMWKYVLICSVAVGFAFMGTLLVAAATPATASGTSLFWTSVLASAERLDPRLMRAAFIFLLVGYGTKAGLAPMHNWLPDAHSQAPAPVSALFSGFTLNAALYCVFRFVPIVEAVPGCRGWPRDLLLGFGLASVLVGSAFVLFQSDAKRLLAYCSVEHMGLVVIGVGLGGIGTLAALFHSVNHAIAKTMAFFAVGRLGQAAGSHALARLSGSARVSRLWTIALMTGFFALMGAAPSGSFVSELQLLRAAFDRGRPVVLSILLVALGVAFVGMARHVLRLAWGRPEGRHHGGSAPPQAPPPLRIVAIERALVTLCIGLVVLFGLWLPAWLAALLGAAAQVVDGGLTTTTMAAWHP